MKRRLLPFALIISSAVVVYACSDSSSGTDTPVNPGAEGGPGTEGGSTDPDGGGTDPDGSTGDDGGVNPNANPIEGIAAAKQITAFVDFVDGPQWLDNALYVTQPNAENTTGGGPGLLARVVPNDTIVGQQTEITARAGAGALRPIGNSVDKNGALITAETSAVRRMVIDGGVTTTVADTFAADGGSFPFNGVNDLVARLSDNTIFVTDPGYNADGTLPNRLIKIAPNGTATLLDQFIEYPKPNGIALSKDEKTLYISFTDGFTADAKPHIRKYTVNADGTVKDPTKFAELPAEGKPDGLAVDDSGNLYVAWKNGINVYRADGTRYGAEPSLTIPASFNAGAITNLTFGRADRKSLFVTTASGKVFEIVVKIPGLVQ